MNRFLILLFSISLIGCCEEPKLMNNGLTKSASKITEYTIKVGTDSLNLQEKDTLVITIKKYNRNNQVISRNQRNLFEDVTMEIEYVYNEENKIQKEIVKLSNDSTDLIVNYYYQDTLLIQTKAETKHNVFEFKQISEYQYSPDSELQESVLKQIYINVETNDTITNILELSQYNEKEYVTQLKKTDFIKPERNRITKFHYDCGTLKKVSEFNSKDSLISTTEYKYEIDKFKNWNKRESYKNEKLNYIRTREIEYK